MDDASNGESRNFEDLLLKSSRNGDYKTVSEILKANEEGKASININCKGQSKCNLGWSPLHLACYFGHKECVDILLQNGADVDLQNDLGDTPLHKASLTNREGIVMLLLENGASVSIINGEGLKASDLARKSQVMKLIVGAERAEHKIKEEKFIHATREGDVETVRKIMSDPFAPNINCTDSMGNTGLHCAAYRGHINVAVILLQNGCDSSIKNASGQTALELVQSQQMEQVLAVPPVKSFARAASRFEGPLLRRMRIVGWRMVWCVLERGVLTFFSSRADASSGVGRRDYKYLDSAKVIPAIGGEQSVFLVQYSDGTRHRLASLPDPVHSASVNRQKWVSALTDHIKFSTHYVQHGFSIDDDDEGEKSVKPLGCMQDALATARAHQELVEQQVEEVMALISYLDDERLKQGSVHNIIKKFNNLSTTARNMTSSLSHCLSLMKQQEEVRELQLKEEKEKVRVLEESLRVLATEHHDLEESIASRLSSSSGGFSLYNTPANSFMSLPRPRRFFPSGADEEFFDAFSQDDDTCTLKSLPSPCGSECSTNALVSCMSSLPLDPQSPEGGRRTTNNEVSSNSLNSLPSPSVPSSAENKNKGVMYTKLTSSSTRGVDKTEVDEVVGVATTPAQMNAENESIVTISSGTYVGRSSAGAGGSSTLTISLSDSNHVTSTSHFPSSASSSSFAADDDDGAKTRVYECRNPSAEPSPSSLSSASVAQSSNNSHAMTNNGTGLGVTSSSTSYVESVSSVPLPPETPLVRTSDLSDAEGDGSGESDVTISSQGQKKEPLVEGADDSSSSFSLIYLGGTRYKGAHGGRRRLWRNWGRRKRID